MPNYSGYVQVSLREPMKSCLVHGDPYNCLLEPLYIYIYTRHTTDQNCMCKIIPSITQTTTDFVTAEVDSVQEICLFFPLIRIISGRNSHESEYQPPAPVPKHAQTPSTFNPSTKH